MIGFPPRMPMFLLFLAPSTWSLSVFVQVMEDEEPAQGIASNFKAQDTHMAAF